MGYAEPALKTLITTLLLTFVLAGLTFAQGEESSMEGNTQKPTGKTEIYDNLGHYQGQIDEKGQIFDSLGKFKGTVRPDGQIFDGKGKLLGIARNRPY